MKTLTKKITVGEYSFDIGTNRDIAVKALEEFPDFAKFIFEQDKTNGKDLVLEALKNKELSKYFKLQDQEQDVVLFALPYMYEAANNKKIDFKDKFIAYLEENDAMGIFVEKVFEFLMLGFTQKENKPKVKFTLM